jgi:hypothetical protein
LRFFFCEAFTKFLKNAKTQKKKYISINITKQEYYELYRYIQNRYIIERARPGLGIIYCGKSKTFLEQTNQIQTKYNATPPTL